MYKYLMMGASHDCFVNLKFFFLIDGFIFVACGFDSKCYIDCSICDVMSKFSMMEWCVKSFNLFRKLYVITRITGLYIKV